MVRAKRGVKRKVGMVTKADMGKGRCHVKEMVSHLAPHLRSEEETVNLLVEDYRLAQSCHDSGVMSDTEYDVVEIWMSNEKSSCVTAAKLIVDFKFDGRKKDLVGNEAMVEILYIMTDIVIGEATKAYLLQEFAGSVAKQKAVEACRVASDLFIRNMPYPLPNGGLAKLEDMSSEQMASLPRHLRADLTVENKPVNVPCKGPGQRAEAMRVADRMDSHGRTYKVLEFRVFRTGWTMWVRIDQLIRVMAAAGINVA